MKGNYVIKSIERMSMKKRKILLYIHEMTYTGSPFSTLRLGRALQELGCNVEVWSYKDGIFRNEYEKSEMVVRIVPETELRRREVIKVVKKFDLMIANTILTRKAVEMAENFIPTIWYIREAENIPEFFMNDFNKFYALKGARNIWCVSEYAAKFISDYFNKNVEVIYNCVDDEARLIEEKDSNISKSKVSFYMSGTIEKRKGYDIFIKAFEQLEPYYQGKCELHIVGRKFEHQPQYVQQIVDATDKYKENIIYHGEISDRKELLNLMNQCDIVTVISRDESCSLVALEGCMLGKPLLLSENVGAKYLVDTKNGWISKTGDIEQLTNILKDIIKHKEKFSEMGNVSRKRYEETSTFEKYKKQIAESLDKYFCKSKMFYRLQNFGSRFVWWVDDLERVYVPDWGDDDEEKHLYSFDIFDTLITRKVATPSGIFLTMQEKLISDSRFEDIPLYIKENFYTLRQHSEALARKSYCIKGCEDKTFEQIYEALGCNGMLTPNQIERIKSLELEIEEECVVGVEENINRIKEYVQEGKNVVLISDMYLSAEQIRHLLCKVDIIFRNIEIYVSSECKKTKGSTNLFKYVQCEKKVKFSNWTHIGDNDFADGRAPRRLGIKTEIYKGTMLKKSEKKVIDGKQRDIQAQYTIGLSRRIRVQNHLAGAKSIGASVGGIMLVPYVQWVLSEAQRREIRRLYFIARDGYVLKKIADIIIEKCNYQIETRYLYGSRKAWRMPSYKKEDSLEIFFKMAHLGQLHTVGDLSKIFFISEEEFRKYLPIKYRNYEKVSWNDIMYFKSFLEEREDFKEMLEKESEKRRKNVIGYLKQEIDFTQNDFAFVELSGSGATQECLVKICGEFYDKDIITFFLNLDNIKHGEKCLFLNYLQNNNRMTVIIENLCRAPHGQTISYEYKDEKYFPVLEEHEVEALISHGYEEYVEGVCLFTQEYYSEKFICDFMKENPQLYISFLHYISYTADIEILDFIGGMPFESTGFGENVVEFAPRLNEKQIKDIFYLRDKENIDELYQGAELQYSINRCTNDERKLIKSYQEKALSLEGHMARIRKKLSKNGLWYTTVFVFKRTIRRFLIKMSVIPNL